MSSITNSAIAIQTCSHSAPSTPCWFGEVTVMAHVLKQQGRLSTLQEQVRFARRRFGRYDVIDFVAVLLGYAISGEPTLKTFYERLQPFASPFMALFGRDHLPARSTLSRFLAALDQAPVEALRKLFLVDLLAQPLAKEGKAGGMWDRQGRQWLVFDVDGTRQAARQRALPCTADLPATHRRLEKVCAAGYLGRKRGEVVRTRTTVLQAHTHQWVGTFSGSGNGDYRAELRRAVEALKAYVKAQSVPPGQAVVRLDGQYGNGAIVADLDGLAYVMRGKDYGLLDLPEVQTRLSQPPDQQTTHPETGTCRALFDCPDLPLSPTGPRTRVIVATHPATATAAKIGTTRGELVYELFYTALPQHAFTPADVVALYLHRGAFETVLADEDQEQDPDRWCSQTPCGQEFWQILCQWVWNLRLRLGHGLHPTPLRLTEFAAATAAAEAVAGLSSAASLSEEPATVAAEAVTGLSSTASASYGPAVLASSWKRDHLQGQDFVLQPDGTLRCPASHLLYPQERRPERDGTVRVVYAARIGDCRPCPLREHCQWHGTSTKHPRRVSAVLHPHNSAPQREHPPPRQVPTQPALAAQPILWADWERCFHRREWVKLLRQQRVDIRGPEPSPAAQPPPARPISRAQRAHYRLSWDQRLARNAVPSTSPSVSITLFGLPDAFAQAIGLQTL